MSVLTGVLGMGRTTANSRMTETVIGYEVTGTDTDEDTLEVTETRVVLYSGPGWVRYPSAAVSDRESASQLPAVQDVQVRVPVDSATNLRTGHFFQVTASAADISLVGRRFRVKGAPQAGQTTTRRFPVEETS